MRDYQTLHLDIHMYIKVKEHERLSNIALRHTLK
jgi:hypothetical protein